MNRQDLVQHINKTIDALSEADELWKSPFIYSGRSYNPVQASLANGDFINIELYPLFSNPSYDEMEKIVPVTLETAEGIANNLGAVLSTYLNEEEDVSHLIDNVNDIVQLNGGEVKICWGKAMQKVGFSGFEGNIGIPRYAYACFVYGDEDPIQLAVHQAQIVTIAHAVLDVVDLRALLKQYREDPKPIF